MWLRLSILYARPVDELQRVISSPHFNELKAADVLGLLPHPWLQTAMQCREITNATRSGGKPATIDDYMPDVDIAIDEDEAKKQLNARYGTPESGDDRTGLNVSLK